MIFLRDQIRNEYIREELSILYELNEKIKDNRKKWKQLVDSELIPQIFLNYRCSVRQGLRR